MENPSGANHCMFCGNPLVAEEELDEVSKLRKELAETKKTKDLLETALKSQLKEKEKKVEVKPKPVVVSPPPQVIPPLVTPSPPPPPPSPPKSNKNRSLMLTLVVVGLIMIFSIVFWINGDKQDNIQKELEATQQTLSEQEKVNKDLKSKQEQLQKQKQQLQEQKLQQEQLLQKEKQKNQYVIDMVFVESGTFMMGCTEEQEGNCFDNEYAVHKVSVNSFYIGKYEVTQAQWRAVMGNNPSYANGDNLPVESVYWIDVQKFIEKLNVLTGKSYRLPTEAEWEYAVRGGNKSRKYKYSGSNSPSDVAWFASNSNNKTHAVGSKQPNELGIYDMSGNVLEWCADWWDEEYSSESQINPVGPESGSFHVNRGGKCSSGAKGIRVSVRGMR
jgi:formylglycine-generating enzyme required for sulfatase activity